MGVEIRGILDVFNVFRGFIFFYLLFGLVQAPPIYPFPGRGFPARSFSNSRTRYLLPRVRFSKYVLLKAGRVRRLAGPSSAASYPRI